MNKYKEALDVVGHFASLEAMRQDNQISDSPHKRYFNKKLYIDLGIGWLKELVDKEISQSFCSAIHFEQA